MDCYLAACQPIILHPRSSYNKPYLTFDPELLYGGFGT